MRDELYVPRESVEAERVTAIDAVMDLIERRKVLIEKLQEIDGQLETIRQAVGG